MTKSEFIRKILLADEDQYSLLADAESERFDEEVFEILVSQLKHKDYRNIFLVLDFLIQKYPRNLLIDSQNLAPKFIELIKHESGPVVDRSQWALNLTGKNGLNLLIDAYQTNDLKFKAKIVFSISKNEHLNLEKAKVIELLLDAIDHSNSEIQYQGVYSIMMISPLLKNKNQLLDYDFTEIYTKVLPISYRFSHTPYVKHYFPKLFHKLILHEFNTL